MRQYAVFLSLGLAIRRVLASIVLLKHHSCRSRLTQKPLSLGDIIAIQIRADHIAVNSHDSCNPESTSFLLMLGTSLLCHSRISQLQHFKSPRGLTS
ncbi:hypothetical protein GGI35DRAFT_177813 [Trichoderma velutinum]